MECCPKMCPWGPLCPGEETGVRDAFGLLPVWYVESLTPLRFAELDVFVHIGKFRKMQGSRWMCGQSELSVSFLVTRIVGPSGEADRKLLLPSVSVKRMAQLAGGLFLGLEYPEGKESCLFQHSYFKRFPSKFFLNVYVYAILYLTFFLIS